MVDHLALLFELLLKSQFRIISPPNPMFSNLLSLLRNQDVHLTTQNYKELAWPITFKEHCLPLKKFSVTDSLITEIKLFFVIFRSHLLEVAALLQDPLNDEQMLDCPLFAWNFERR